MTVIDPADRTWMLDPNLLRTFLVIAQGHSFSETSRKLAMRQSTVSDHVRRLEENLGRQLFIRDTHSVTLTPQGEALIAFARTILETSERAERHFAGTKLRGKVRFGASEDLVLSWLPSVLKTFTDDHPGIDLEFTVALSSTLITRYDKGEIDIVLCKRWPGDTRGQLVWQDEIVWAAADPAKVDREAQLPLILYPPPSITRSMALAALSQSGIAWRIVCTSDTLNGVIAATRAGLGAMVLARRLLPDELYEIDANAGLPPLGVLDFVLLRDSRLPRAPVAELAASIIEKAERI